MWPSVERFIRYVRASIIDLRLFLTGKQDAELPPLRLRFVGEGDFRDVGKHLLDLTVRYGRIGPDSRILDIGSGSGRLALALMPYLRDGRYEGFDVVGAAVRWCRRNITRTHPNFRFTHAALRNSDYRARGGDASRFVFPYASSSFDCAVAYSVFTHLRFAEMDNYLRETCRVLAPGGRLVATFFLINRQSEEVQNEHAYVQQFPCSDGPVRYASRSNPSFAVAVEEDVVLRRLIDAGFRETSVVLGTWRGLPQSATAQDLVIATK